MLADTELGRLERVDLRAIWATEAQHFTPWLAREENIRELADTVGLTLEVEAQEQAVGPFRADILCRNVDDESWVLIENQLERTDHIHLGQLLTYAAGLHAVTIVWIAAEFTDEHRAAIDWLNEITAESFKFFGLEVELWKIGESLAAPKFNVISKPNDWSRSVRGAARDIEAGELTETKQTYLKYWQSFRDRISGNEMLERAVGKVHASHYLVFRLGRGGFHISSTVSEWEDRIGVEFVIQNAHADEYYQLLVADRDEIEEELGFKLDWDELPERKRSKVSLFKFGVGIMDRENWNECQSWMEAHLSRLFEVLGPRVQRLELDAT